MDQGTAEKRVRLRYAGNCRVCGIALPAKSHALWDRTTKTVRCTTHEDGSTDEPTSVEVVDPGTPGSSARREFERRRASRDERVRNGHPKIGGFLLAITDEPQSTKAWAIGADGEEKLGRQLEELAAESLRVLHDRRIPGSRANIDHVVVAPSGVWVIDTKRYRGRPRLRVEGGFFGPRVERLLVGTRDCTKLVDGVLKQVDVVRGFLDQEVPVHGALCFVEAEWPLIGGSFTTRGVHVVWPRKLIAKLQADGPLGVDEVAELHRRLARALPSA